jgi:hypothetical protein
MDFVESRPNVVHYPHAKGGRKLSVDDEGKHVEFSLCPEGADMDHDFISDSNLETFGRAILKVCKDKIIIPWNYKTEEGLWVAREREIPMTQIHSYRFTGKKYNGITSEWA